MTSLRPPRVQNLKKNKYNLKTKKIRRNRLTKTLKKYGKRKKEDNLHGNKQLAVN